MTLLLIVLAVIGIYFAPTIIAVARNRENQTAIMALNFLLGWTLIGWVVSLVWALASDRPNIIYIQAPPAARPSITE